jgi:MoaA/NifB/PqqE/SkfB family radical SAM enzyme|tara:strand:+ start:1359 stop:2057 length:699 start_codon:yes stop_codon:yes gene_type:complete
MSYEGLNTNFAYIDDYGPWRRRINLEASTRCNLLCPGCNRTQQQDLFTPSDLSIEDFKLLVRPENNLHALTYNMALGDPIYSGTLFEQLKHINTLENRPVLFFSTNGSGRSNSWWEQFANYLNPTNPMNENFPGDTIEFAVDGLKDTNHIYRINSKWDSIINGMKTLREKYTGKLAWRYLVFEHNYHQVAEAQKLATDIGLDEFHCILGDDRTPKEMILSSKTWEQVLHDLS